MNEFYLDNVVFDKFSLTWKYVGQVQSHPYNTTLNHTTHFPLTKLSSVNLPQYYNNNNNNNACSTTFLGPICQ